MMNFKLKLKLHERIKNELDTFIWDIFDKYIKFHRINFNGPDHWEYNHSYIGFKGTDGCRGCYDHMILDIPIEWFHNFEACKTEFEEKMNLKIQEDEARKKAIQLKIDQEHYERLKKQFETGEK